ILNLLVRDFRNFVTEASNWQDKEEYEKISELKTLLGHQPIEAFFGALTGVGIGFLLSPLFISSIQKESGKQPFEVQKSMGEKCSNSTLLFFDSKDTFLRLFF